MSPVSMARSSQHPHNVDMRVLAFICLVANVGCIWKLFSLVEKMGNFF